MGTCLGCVNTLQAGGVGARRSRLCPGKFLPAAERCEVCLFMALGGWDDGHVHGSDSGPIGTSGSCLWQWRGSRAWSGTRCSWAWTGSGAARASSGTTTSSPRGWCRGWPRPGHRCAVASPRRCGPFHSETLVPMEQLDSASKAVVSVSLLCPPASPRVSLAVSPTDPCWVVPTSTCSRSGSRGGGAGRDGYVQSPAAAQCCRDASHHVSSWHFSLDISGCLLGAGMD